MLRLEKKMMNNNNFGIDRMPHMGRVDGDKIRKDIDRQMKETYKNILRNTLESMIRFIDEDVIYNFVNENGKKITVSIKVEK